MTTGSPKRVRIGVGGVRAGAETEDGALLDVISGDRFVLGVAIGYKPDEFALYRTPLEGQVQ